jgi:acyl dehydratase
LTGHVVHGLDAQDIAGTSLAGAGRRMSRQGLSFEGLRALTGQELGVSDWITVDQDKIDQFADCTGDRQWIHVDAERARKESPFRRPIAHGYLTLSLVSAMMLDIDMTPDRACACARCWFRWMIGGRANIWSELPTPSRWKAIFVPR